MAHQYMPKIIHGPHKNPPDPRSTYLIYGLKQIDKFQWKAFAKNLSVNINYRKINHLKYCN